MLKRCFNLLRRSPSQLRSWQARAQLTFCSSATPGSSRIQHQVSGPSNAYPSPQSIPRPAHRPTTRGPPESPSRPGRTHNQTLLPSAGPSRFVDEGGPSLHARLTVTGDVSMDVDNPTVQVSSRDEFQVYVLISPLSRAVRCTTLRELRCPYAETSQVREETQERSSGEGFAEATA